MVNVYLHIARLLVLILCIASAATAQDVRLTPLKPTGIYDVGEKVGWTVSGGSGKYTYTAKRNNLDVITTGELDPSTGNSRIELTVDEPAMVYLELKPANGEQPKRGPIVAGAAVAPTALRPSVPRPADFDEFWDAKIKELKAVPENPVFTPKDIGRADIEFGVLRMDQVGGKHVYGQLAKPKKAGKFPALLIFQWASPPYPLQRDWVTQHAANGWLTLNVEPHDVLPDQPQAYYDALPKELKNYQTIGMEDRDKSYFLQMYLGDYRAVDYMTQRDDWDGKTLVVMGTSMGGQQSFAVGGLHDRVTHLLVDVPAGCDLNASLHGRQMGYPFFPADNAKVMQTALYFDAVNFARRIKATSLVAMGFVDTITPPAGIWTAFNQIKGLKEVVPLVDSPHNHQATPEQQRPWTKRSAEWLDAIRSGKSVVFDDHQDMMNQLGIKSMRPGANGNDPSAADESKANIYKDSMPDVLTMKDGTKVAKAEQWPKRRAEIAEDFEREVYGRIPNDVPNVTWEVTGTAQEKSGDVPVVTKTLVGHVDNAGYPQIAVNIQATFTVPANAKAPVPVMLVFGRPFPGFPRLSGRVMSKPWTEQAIEHGWGYGYVNPGSIQPDNNQLTTAGIIGLTNKGKPRTPEQWGALRAWQWGVSRIIDYFEANPDAKVDAKKVGIEGVSRYGKAALVTQAFDQRVAVALVASSGQGGAKLHRHVFGERVENLTGGLYYWMAGNYLKYGAADPAKTAADLPVDSHELIALCAPRPCFISYGTVAGGDPNWVDARGSFMAGVLAGPVYRLLGKHDFGTPGDYLTDPLPPVGQLIGGELAWRQHEGGHDVTPNWPAFFEWVGKYVPATRDATLRPEPRADANSQTAHQQLLAKAKHGGIDVYFVGDSITRRWGATDPQYKDLLANWTQNFHGWNAANFGWGADGIQHILWRMNNGELDGVNPKVIVIQAGTNNLTSHSADEIAAGLKSLLEVCREKAPRATIILTGVFPRAGDDALHHKIEQVNDQLARLADGKAVRYLNVNDHLGDASGKPLDGMTGDGLHPSVKGYQVWADGLKPILTELLGPPATTDHAPPPTGDPSISRAN